MDVFFENGNRYNMLHSVVLELFEYICKNVQENYKTLIVYIFDSFWERLMRFQHLGSIRAFRTKYEQSLENFGIKNTANAAGTKRRIDEQALEKEEAYFKENRPLSGGLVDYEDDDEEEEEDNLKPPRMSEASTGDNENCKPVKSKRKSVSKVEIKDELELSKKQRLDQWSGDDYQANVTTTSSPSS
ncbi:hypothetical protein IHE45_07G024700 [Dioscorea alata]|uniref:Uncharacterized protein n=1 Tax=Dioscorea alata TaxID=55571 RepID=A0ACB7VQC2_DIOAL|nr:hypothetical protein IHE45_07G024700 [Dioscorea alata]